MSRKPPSLEHYKEAAALQVIEAAPRLRAAEYCGVLAVVYGTDTRRITFRSGALGLTNVRLCLELETPDTPLETKTSWCPERPGNLLFIPENALIDTRIEVSSEWHRIPYDGRDLTLAIMHSLATREVDGVRYDACVTYGYDAVARAQRIIYALPDSTAPERRLVPLPDDRVV
jgi:hypothetical protein